MNGILFIDATGSVVLRNSSNFQESGSSFCQFTSGIVVNLHRICLGLGHGVVLLVPGFTGCVNGKSAPAQDTISGFSPELLFLLKNEGISILGIHSFPLCTAADAETENRLLEIVRMYTNTPFACPLYLLTDRISKEVKPGQWRIDRIMSETPNLKGVPGTISCWDDVYNMLRSLPRSATITRTTKETTIELAISIDGEGKSLVETPYGFLTHMLELFAFHSKTTLTATVKGDIHVDEHHTVEDTALALGAAIIQAMGDKRNTERYGFVLPMDESLCTMSLDFSGRPCLVWNVRFFRETIGSMPTELFYHFFKSFCDSARCTLHIEAQGVNEHHKIEAIFKAFGRCILQAAKRTEQETGVPSSKGIL